MDQWSYSFIVYAGDDTWAIGGTRVAGAVGNLSPEWIYRGLILYTHRTSILPL